MTNKAFNFSTFYPAVMSWEGKENMAKVDHDASSSSSSTKHSRSENAFSSLTEKQSEDDTASVLSAEPTN